MFLFPFLISFGLNIDFTTYLNYLFVERKVFIETHTVDWSGRRRRLLENANAFSSCVGGFEDVIQCPAGVRGRGDPAGAKAQEALRHARGKRSRLERKSTDLLKSLYINNIITNQRG
ncbi:hypothetical protein CHR53_18970 [Neobacillus mesonae]|uniref:Uncharacterized protein n=1 Tax=Neobacillus mesonae TaxID=1193713 RepID=A0A3Q9QTZ2_9BACI|nr:hypothetical protein CHR53_18970 [Neobacillus mesonae]